MRMLVLAGAVMAMAAFVSAPEARAADLDRDPAYDDDRRSGSPYDDPRYGGVYRHPEPRRHADRRYEDERLREDERRYADRYEPEDEDDRAPSRYDEPDRDERYHRPPARYDRHAEACAPRHLVREALLRKGWRHFHDIELRHRVALVSARGRDGHLYRLRIHRCSGEVLAARPMYGGNRSPAWAHAPRRHDRPYWN
jgi:hypothetical protein